MKSTESSKISRKVFILSCLYLLTVLLFISSSSSADDKKEWENILKKANGQTVDWYMWGGSPTVNSFINGYVAESVKDKYGIKLRQVPVKDISTVISKLLVEKNAGKTENGKIDLIWINGENFRTAKKHELLYGPFADKLPNKKLVDWNKPSISNDFGEPVLGYESPWGGAQVVMSYNSERVPNPPESVGEFIEWIKKNPGRVAYPALPDFTGSVFVRHIFYHVSGSPDYWQNGYDMKKFNIAAGKCFDLLNEIEPYLWRKGEIYPESPERVAQLLADGQIDFSIGYDPSEASKKIHDGIYPSTIRTFVFKEGTIANTHFVAIPFNASDTDGAMVVANFLLSGEAQYNKADPKQWGDIPVIETTRLDPVLQDKFRNLDRGVATLPQEILQKHQLPELPSELLVELEKGWQKHVLKKR